MSYCPECGEKIAKDDVFCPFCGITITPIAPVNDASMSETIVDMKPISINKETLDAMTAKDETATSAVENEHATARHQEPATPENPEKAVGFSAGDTSENWSMKTDSVDIPAGFTDEYQPIPLPPEFSDDEPKELSEITSKEAEKEESVQPESISEIPTPAIIQTPEIEPVQEAPESFQPLNSTISEPIETFEPEIESPIANFEAVEAKVEDTESVSENLEKSVPDEPRYFIDPLALDPQSIWAEPSASAGNKVEVPELEPINSDIEKPRIESFDPPIAMPEAPFALESENDQTKFDSVQIIQKDEKPAESTVEAKSEVEEITPVSEPQDASKEGRPFTTPNIGNADTDGRKAAKLKPLEEGVILNGRYEIVRKIGGGGMGAVYLANDRNLGGVLRAVKEMVQSYIESDQQDKAISDFKRESMLLTSLDHPAIPTIYDYFYDEKEARFYLVMKYISGGDLSGRLRAAPEGRIDEKSVTEWAIQVADVLDYLHKHEPPIVYRDLKPANVMIDGNSGRVMLIDFGIARWVNKEEKGVTAVGTMGYAPPELFSGNVEARSDIYSLGSTMFHLLTGADPQSNPLLIFDFQKNPRPRQINSQLSDQIERILMRSVEYNADMRFSSAGQLRDELKEHLNNLQAGKVSYGIKAAPSPPTFSEQNVFCGFCGRQIVATDVFCAFCGAQQPIAQQSFSQPAVAVQTLTAKLMIVGTGELEPSIFKLEKHENLLGRRDPMSNIFPEVDLSKYDPQTKISRRHARIWRDGNNFLVEDLGSSNGTTLLPPATDSIRLLPHQPHNLTNGDKIRLGDTTLHFTIG